MRAITSLLAPLTKLFGLGKGGHETSGERTELEILAEIGEEESNIEEDERRMIRRILRLEDTAAREIMVPRTDIVAVDVKASLAEVIDLVLDRGYTRIPLYQDTIDNIVGIIYAKDLLGHLRNGESQASIQDIARPAYFIPESKKIDELLRELQERRVHMAIVVDEYGGVAGLVTIEDLLEEIVGEIEDEYDTGEPHIEQLSETEAIVDAKLGIDDLNELLGLSLETGDFDTVGGFVYAQLGRIPTVNDQLEVEGLTISVLSTTGRRIKKVKVAKKPVEGTEEAQPD